MKYLYWLALLPISFVIGLFGRLLSPIVCLFVERKPRFDTVKRLGGFMPVLFSLSAVAIF